LKLLRLIIGFPMACRMPDKAGKKDGIRGFGIVLLSGTLSLAA
jgi:hypothetical protein